MPPSTPAPDGNATAPHWLADFFFGQVEAAREARIADPGLPAYPWLPDGTTYRPLEGAPAYPLSFVYSATTKRYPVLINLDELRRNVHLALAGTPDTRTPQQKSRDAWAAYQAAKARFEAKYERRDSSGSATAPGTATGEGEARQAAGSPQDGVPDGSEPEASGPTEGPPPAA
jgi:hypothetical protein